MVSALAAEPTNVTLYGFTGDQPTNVGDLVNRFQLSSDSFQISLRKDHRRFGGRFLGGLNAALNAKFSGENHAIARCPYSALMAVSLGIKTILEIHVIPRESSRKRGLIRRLLKSKNLVAVVVITDMLRQDFNDTFDDSSGRPCLVIPDGADVVRDDQIDGKIDLGYETNIGYVGSLYPGKGVEVVEQLAAKNPDVGFHVVGGSGTIFESKVNANHLNNLTFHGYQKQRQVGRFLKGFDVVLLPNQQYVEDTSGKDIGRWTSPLKLFEYMANGKPILSSDLPVLREILVNGHNALLCEADNIESWQSALLRLLGDDVLRKKIASQAKMDLEQRYSWTQRSRLLLNAHTSKG